DMNVVQIMKALADETRLRIVYLLQKQELNVNELVTILEMGQSRISRHLKILADSGIVTSRRDGLWVFYSIHEKEELHSFLRQIAKLLEELPVIGEDEKRRDFVIMQRTKETTRLFDTLAGNWKHIKAEIFGDVNIIQEIYQILPPCDSVVDIGCGTGDLLGLLKNKVKTVIGVDNSPKMLEQARYFLNREDNTIDLRLGMIEHLPLGDQEVESGVINMVLHHSNTPLSVLKEARRVLKPGGNLVVVDFQKHTREIMRTQYGDRRLGFDSEELKIYFKKTGLIINTEKHYPLTGGLKIMLYILINNLKEA
ncbi:MAG: ArsR family transcriptional regulator, partial [Spirochaetales bacterium]|nr:ArsR family transcriptional regulator [Spirochaetales bacterium]